MKQVLVVGAGPTGLTLACELYRHGVSCRLIDQRTIHVDRSRAVDVQSRTLHVFDDMGIARELLSSGRVLRGMSIYDGARRLAHVDYRADDTPFPFAVSIPQADTERILERRLSALGGRVERGVSLRELRAGADGVEVTTSEDGDTRVSKYDWVVGCDGVASTVRDAVRISFEPQAAAQSFATADCIVRWAFPGDELALFVAEHGFLLALPLPGEGRMRLIADVDAASGKPMDLDSFSALVRARLGTEATLEQPGFVGTYQVRPRIAEAFRGGRVLLAGDAAHSYNPVGGHGMNQGIQDAYNLGWKMALVLRGRSAESLLESYAIERRAVARTFTRDMGFAARLTLSKLEIAREERDRLLDFAVRTHTVQRVMLDSALPHLTVYEDSPLTNEVVVGGQVTPPGVSAGSCAPDVRLGEREPSVLELLRGTEHVLLLLRGTAGGDTTSLVQLAREVRDGYGDVVRVVVAVVDDSDLDWDGTVLRDPTAALHDRYGAAESCAFLIRPDGHIGFRSSPVQAGALRGYLRRIFTS